MGKINKKLYVKCKKKARKLYKHITKDKNSLWQHIKCVEKIAKFFCKNMKLTKSQKYTIYLGCILHDVGRTKKATEWYYEKYKHKPSVKDHNTVGAEYLREKFFCKKRNLDGKEKDIIIKMVENHKGMFDLKCVQGLDEQVDITFETFAIALVRFADKMANEKICVIDGDVHVKL